MNMCLDSSIRFVEIPSTPQPFIGLNLCMISAIPSSSIFWNSSMVLQCFSPKGFVRFV